MARQKEFDPEAVLAQAMAVFWAQGYEKTSMQDLVAHMGVHKRSMYDTFGDKHTLFLKSLDHYTSRAEATFRSAVDAHADGKAALRALIEGSIEAGTEHSRGCMLVNCATELAPRDAEAAEQVERHFERTRQLLVDLVARDRDRRDAEALGTLLFNAWLGLRVQARAGKSAAQLHRMAESLYALLD
ncbi:TetR/AcrR family transcriptional regulator [Amycolatopsis sp. 195334CR]|uniref:TetR/AcrR family transcriptional regulator n=1 Tax=Amycolatopsis sp. 195334CR TaxID=2814588 RepID=UPI001A8D4C6D|nr:TetR/AcrR family transcriptional regulator [Amycolatopsis sp. 195334CR]MBN6036877.1 TetR/AcrR family transcriptional regulator [Amycolatopsis sp. 195334CR]